MPQGMVALALWLSMCEYSGVWDHGRFPGNYDHFEQFSFLGDHKGRAVFDTLQVYSMGMSLGLVWCTVWYQNDFVEWAKAILHLLDVPDVYKHKPNQQSTWCGMTQSLYLFVTKVEATALLGSVGRADEWWRMEDPLLMPASDSMLIPKWGVHLQDSVDSQTCEESRVPDFLCQGAGGPLLSEQVETPTSPTTSPAYFRWC